MASSARREAPQPYHALNAWYRSGLLTGGALLVLGALVAQTEVDHSETFTDVPELARLARASVSACRKHIALLKARGAITQTQRGSRYRASGWRINEPPRSFSGGIS